MKKLIAILLFCVAYSAYGQITDSTVLRNYINANIQPNGTRAITGTQLNTSLIGMLNVMPRYLRNHMDTVFVKAGTFQGGDTLFYIKGGNLYYKTLQHSFNYVPPALTGTNTFVGINSFTGTDTVTATTYGLRVNKTIKLNANGIGGALFEIDGNVSNFGGHTGSFALALNSTSTLSSVFAGKVYAPTYVTNGIQINYDPTHTILGPYYQDFYDSAVVLMGRMFNSTKHFTWGNGLDYGAVFNVAGTVRFNDTAKLMVTPAAADADINLAVSATGIVTARTVASATTLKAWVYSTSYGLTSITRDSNGAIVTASVAWPDGGTGTFTTDTFSTSFPGAIDAYHITYIPSVGTTRTITQSLLTRDGTGAVTAQPALTVTP